MIDLGAMPLTAAFRCVERADAQQATYPLEIGFCPDCALVQVVETVQPTLIFNADYPYFSSYAGYWLEHARELALTMIKRLNLDENSLAVEVGSNDGYLLRVLDEKGIGVMGIDPAGGPAAVARELGVPTITACFDTALAEQLSRQGKHADIIFALNVVAHVADLHDLFGAIRRLLKPTGRVVIEVAYVRDMVERLEFDTIYHEHLCYYSLTSLADLVARHDLSILHAERLTTHGGSLRVIAAPKGAADDSVSALLQEEADLGLTEAGYYQQFADRVVVLGQQLLKLITDLKARGATLAGYGAAAKGVILLNYLGLDCDTIDYIADRNVHKQQRYLPGTHIPVCEPARIMKDKPDYVIVLAWNLADDIRTELAEYHAGGGRLIIPIPKPTIV